MAPEGFPMFGWPAAMTTPLMTTLPLPLMPGLLPSSGAGDLYFLGHGNVAAGHAGEAAAGAADLGFAGDGGYFVMGGDPMAVVKAERRANAAARRAQRHAMAEAVAPADGGAPSVVRGQWTAEEDRLLVQLVEQYGIRKWAVIAKHLGGRIGKQCRERWHNHLRPNIKKENWTAEEETMLVRAHMSIGNRWAEIAKHIPDRSENSIKNHWNATKRSLKATHRCRKKTEEACPRPTILEGYIRSTEIKSSEAAGTAANPAVAPSDHHAFVAPVGPAMVAPAFGSNAFQLGMFSNVQPPVQPVLDLSIHGVPPQDENHRSAYVHDFLACLESNYAQYAPPAFAFADDQAANYNPPYPFLSPHAEGVDVEESKPFTHCSFLGEGPNLQLGNAGFGGKAGPSRSNGTGEAGDIDLPDVAPLPVDAAALDLTGCF